MTASQPVDQGLIVRRFRDSDTTALMQLIGEHSEYEGYPPPAANLIDLLPPLLLGGTIQCWVLEEAGPGLLVGYATGTEDHATFTGLAFGHLDCLFVRDSFRGRRGGQLLFDSVRQWSMSRGHAELQWQTPDWNVRAHAFYQRQGATSRTKERFTLGHQA